VDGNERMSAPGDDNAGAAPDDAGDRPGAPRAPGDANGSEPGSGGAGASPAGPEGEDRPLRPTSTTSNTDPAGGTAAHASSPTSTPPSPPPPATTSGAPGPTGAPAPTVGRPGTDTTAGGPSSPPAPQARSPRADAPQPGAAPPGPPVYGAARQGQPKIFDLPDDRSTRPNGTIVLGGAAAAEGRTTGPNPRIAGPPSNGPRTGDEGDDATAEGETPRGRHFSRVTGDRKWWPLALAAVPVVLLVLLVGGWAVDTAALSGQVMRNVEVGDRSVGGLGEASLPDVMDELNEELAARSVVITAPEPQAGAAGPAQRVFETTAGELGLSVDTEATAQAALDAGRDDALLARPFTWLKSFVSPRQVDVEYAVQESQVVAKMVELQGPELLTAHDPTIQLAESGWVAVPGKPGQGVDTEQIAAALPEQAAESPTGTIEIETRTIDVAPSFTDAEAQDLADRANAMTAGGLTLTAGDHSREVAPEQLRTWIAPTTADGTLSLEIVPETVNAQAAELFADVSTEPVDASFDLQNGTPVVVPSQAGITCCGNNAAELVWQALEAGETSVALEAPTVEPELTTEEAQALGIVQPVGGNNAWRDGQATTAGPGFTTYHACCEARVNNIHRMADIVRGTVVLPGETFSVNDTVGERTTDKGFVPAGAIREGEHVDEVGGGVSQFATTMFNAAYFAGLDITEYQAHSEYFTRYPVGREATMGYPNPDLRFVNDTPHGILIWTSYTDTSLTVTLYSTPHATGAQTGISESMEGQCRIVTTTRTRTWPDGRTANDTFTARYRPGANLNCDGQPINPNPDPG
jgi:vancomycin resistance protein YoaR